MPVLELTVKYLIGIVGGLMLLYLSVYVATRAIMRAYHVSRNADRPGAVQKEIVNG